MNDVDLSPKPETQKQDKDTRLDGVVIGVLIGLDDKSHPLVAFPGNPSATGVEARSTTLLNSSDIGHEVALLFEGGDPSQPLIIGRIQHPEVVFENNSPMTAELDGEHLVFSAKKEIVLKCGKASITLTKAGKVIIRGAYLLNRSSGVNRIKGGSVQIN
ncbi:MAG: DUF6484 domain-containing protein [Pseudomonadota bacterium]